MTRDLPVSPTPPQDDLRKLAEAARPYWGAVDIAFGGNPIAADLVMPFMETVSPASVLALLDERDALRAKMEALLDEAEDVFVCMADATGIDRHNFPAPFVTARQALKGRV